MKEKRWNYFYEIAQQISSRRRREPNPCSLPAAPHLPWLPDQLANKFGDRTLAEAHLFVLSCQEFNFTTSHATNTSVSLQFSMHFVGVFYISLKSHLLSQYHMLLICSKALKRNEKGTITNEKATVNQQPTDIQVPRHCWKKQYCKSDPFKTSNIIVWQEKSFWAPRCSSVIPEPLSAITGFSDHQTISCQCIGERSISNFCFFNWEESFKLLICCTGYLIFSKILI